MGTLAVLTALLTLLPPLFQGGPPTIEDLAELSRKKGKAAQDAIREKFEKILPDLGLPWETQKDFLRERFQAIQELGPAAMPLLAEQLRREPKEPGDEERMRNCARLLQELGAQPYADELLQILEGGRPASRVVVARLLAGMGDRRIVAPLRAQLKDAGNQVAAEYAEALRDVRASEAVPEILELMARKEPRVRRHALRALADVGGPEQLPVILEAFRIEKDAQLLGDYVRYFARHATANAAAADALVPFVGQEGIPDLVHEDLLRALGTVAPEGHKPAMDALRNQLKSLQSSVVRASAWSLLQLGDASGTKIVLNDLTSFINRNKSMPRGYILRGDALLLYGRHAEALKDYKRAVELSPKNTVDATVQVAIARCQAKAKVWVEVQRALKNTGYGTKELKEAIDRHPELKEACEQSPLVKKLLEG